MFRPNANVAVEVLGGTSGTCAPVANGHPLPATPTFQQFDANWDGVYASLYINGHLCSQIEASLPPFPSGASTFYLGFGSQEPWLHGALDEVSYYALGFNADQVHYHYPGEGGRGRVDRTPAQEAHPFNRAQAVQAAQQAQAPRNPRAPPQALAS